MMAKRWPWGPKTSQGLATGLPLALGTACVCACLFP